MAKRNLRDGKRRKPETRPASEAGEGEHEAAAPSGQPIAVVGIGSSAGGLEALEQLLRNLPGDTGMAFVVVSHQAPGRSSLLPELLRKMTPMPVVESLEGVSLEPNRIHVGVSGAQVAVLSGRLHRIETGEEKAPRLPIDYFFQSLARDQGHRAIGVVLSGTGTDGSVGIRAIKDAGGVVLVQQPETAKFAGMPASAIATGLADRTLPPAALARELTALIPCVGRLLPLGDVDPSIPDDALQRIFIVLRDRTGHDFSAYKQTTMCRRIARRMHLHQLEQADQYVRYLQDDPGEADSLFKELLIGVTSFFRDPRAWQAMTVAVERLVATHPEGQALRAWVPGCATGEEAFSLAILIRECLDRAGRSSEVQIFGTDLDANAIEFARGGRYPEGAAIDVGPERLARYFAKEPGGFRVRKEIREMVILARHNVLSDPPFTKLHIISCRNLLIYLGSGLQQRLLPIFHYSLVRDGILFLGTSESLGAAEPLFETRDPRAKVFSRTTPSTAPPFPVTASRSSGQAEAPAWHAPASPGEARVATLIERALLHRHAPVCAVISERGDIVYIHGRAGAYLEPAEGQPSNNILEMAREGLQIDLATAIRECEATGNEVRRRRVPVDAGSEIVQVDFNVSKLFEPEPIRGLLVVDFRRSEPELVPDDGSPSEPVDPDARVRDLERELRSMRQSHRSTLEALAASNAELKSINEEFQSTNEELQSTNEELETTKEETQSLNEELTTVNSELQSKVEDLSESNDDMQNLLNSTDVATIFLDRDLNIRRFTEQAREIVMLRPSDLGRPLSELASHLLDDDLGPRCQAVLDTLRFDESELQTRDGHSYLMRITPYRTADAAIAGLVLTFVGIDSLKRAEREIETARAFYESIVETVREPLLVLDCELRVVSANESFYRTFQTVPSKTEGARIYELASGRWDLPRLRQLLEEILPENRDLDDYRVDIETVGNGPRKFALNARRISRPEGADELILLALEDVTPRRDGSA